MFATVVVTALLCSCQVARVAIVDAGHGFEHVVAERGAHLESSRVTIDELGAGADGTTRYRLALAFELTNGAETPWVLRREDVDVAIETLVRDRDPTGIAVRVAGAGDELVAIAEQATTPLRIPLEISVPAGGDLHLAAQARIRLRVRCGPETLLDKRIGIAIYDPVGMVFRAAAVITAGLVVLSFL